MRFPVASLLSCGKLHFRDLVIKGSESEQQWRDIISQYHGIRKVALLPDSEIVPPVFKACAHLQSVNQGVSLHADVLKQGFKSYTSTCNSIMNFYIKCGMMGSASILFDGMVNKDSVSWNSVIHGFLNNGDAEVGLDLFLQARVSGFKSNVASLVLVLQACWRLGVITEGLNIHSLVIRSGFAYDLSIQNALMSLYAKCEDLESAQRMFDEMSERDVISWSVLISAYGQVGEFLDALKLFQEMSMDTAIGLDGLAAIAILQACGGVGDLRRGMSVHGHLIHRGFDADLFVGNSLIDMYSKCLAVDSACLIFDQMPQKNNVSWNSMLSGLVHNEKYSEALALFDQMKKEGIAWDEVTLVSLLQACKKAGEAMWTKCIHSVIIRQLLDPNEMVLNSLLDAYSKFELMQLALRLFNSMKRRNLISWSTMITGYAHTGRPDEAIAFFRDMRLAQVKPNIVTMLSLLEACAASAELKLSKSAHAMIARNNLAKDLAVSTSLINAYAKCGDTKLSKRVFDKMPERNILTWNVMVGALGMNGHAREALALLNEMESSPVKPNGVTMLSVLSACSHGGLIQEGLSCFQRMMQDPMLQPNVEHYSCIVDMLGRAGDLQNAVKVIRSMPEGLEAGAAAWGALLSACKRHGDCELGREAASRVMEMEPMSPAGYLLTSNMYAGTGLRGDMAKMRALMRERGVRDGNGYSLLHVGQKAHRFVAWDACHPQCREIYCMVELLHGWMKLGVDIEEFIFWECDWDH
ncbi:hypothetical protein J5N97_028962 [Dioscorea zingiberensis]|uniref:Pentatricopeptide repeat-containing protein n=1 Tax=Dioscorea zingiberensis TaxID=325984 RepID=A0A9D5H5G5_9LILI|nr:hypothetical protein J5N97_028962 [Dioscorea zingiberensis]